MNICPSFVNLLIAVRVETCRSKSEDLYRTRSVNMVTTPLFPTFKGAGEALNHLCITLVVGGILNINANKKKNNKFFEIETFKQYAYSGMESKLPGYQSSISKCKH